MTQPLKPAPQQTRRTLLPIDEQTRRTLPPIDERSARGLPPLVTDAASEPDRDGPIETD
jgi:hypothetical protein